MDKKQTQNKAANERVEAIFKQAGLEAPKELLTLIGKQGKQKEVLHEQNKATELCLKAGLSNHEPIRDLIADLNKDSGGEKAK